MFLDLILFANLGNEQSNENTVPVHTERRIAQITCIWIETYFFAYTYKAADRFDGLHQGAFAKMYSANAFGQQTEQPVLLFGIPSAIAGTVSVGGFQACLRHFVS